MTGAGVAPVGSLPAALATLQRSGLVIAGEDQQASVGQARQARRLPVDPGIRRRRRVAVEIPRGIDFRSFAQGQAVAVEEPDAAVQREHQQSAPAFVVAIGVLPPGRRLQRQAASAPLQLVERQRRGGVAPVEYVEFVAQEEQVARRLAQQFAGTPSRRRARCRHPGACSSAGCRPPGRPPGHSCGCCRVPRRCALRWRDSRRG